MQIIYGAISHHCKAVQEVYKFGLIEGSGADYNAMHPITGNTPQDVVKGIMEYTGCKSEHLSYKEDGKVVVNMLNTANGELPTADQEAKWKVGQFRLFRVVYTFRVEKNVQTGVDWNDKANH